MLSAERTKDLIGWGGNVLVSVLIVFCNKFLMGPKGYNFKYATTLSALHFLVCGAALKLTQGQQEKSGGHLPLRDLILFTLVANASIVSLNLSLLLNPVSTYQIAKLLVIPFVCLVERFYFGRHFSTRVLSTIATVIVGVAIVTVEEVSFDGSSLGLILAGMSVVCSGMQQILVRSMQQSNGLTANELLGATAPAQAASLLLMGPPVDKLVTNSWIFNYVWSQPAVVFLVLSCLLAVGVNITQFMVLGRFTASSYQVMGHTKTVLVLLGSWIFLGEKASYKKLGGMALAVFGMIMYGHASATTAPPPSPSGKTIEGSESEKEGLIHEKAIPVVSMSPSKEGKPAAAK